MSDALTLLSRLSVLIFAIASMASIGLRYSVDEIIGPLRDVRGVTLALAANFVAVPILAFGILRLFRLDTPYALGLLLIASAAGAPMIVKFAEIAGGDVAFSAGLLVLLIVVSIAYMPLVVPLLAPGAEINAWAIAAPLVLTMLLPLGAGLLVKRVAPAVWRILPVLGVVANVSLVTLVVLTFALNLPSVRSVFGTGAIIASLLFIGGALGIGWVFGGAFGEHLRDEMALSTAM